LPPLSAFPFGDIFQGLYLFFRPLGTLLLLFPLCVRPFFGLFSLYYFSCRRTTCIFFSLFAVLFVDQENVALGRFPLSFPRFHEATSRFSCRLCSLFSTFSPHISLTFPSGQKPDISPGWSLVPPSFRVLLSLIRPF